MPISPKLKRRMLDGSGVAVVGPDHDPTTPTGVEAQPVAELPDSSDASLQSPGSACEPNVSVKSSTEFVPTSTFQLVITPDDPVTKKISNTDGFCVLVITLVPSDTVKAIGVTAPLKLALSAWLNVIEAVIAHSPKPEIQLSVPLKTVKFGPW